MNTEKPISNKRSFTGYSSVSVVEQIQSLQEKYQRKIAELKEALIIEKEMNQKLKIEVELQQSTPQTNPIEEEMNPMIEDLFEHHMINTKDLLDLQNELKAQETNYENELELKRKEVDRAKQRVYDALQYFQKPPETQGNLGIGMSD